MKRRQVFAALAAVLSLAVAASGAMAAFTGMNSGVTVDVNSNLTGITVPGGKSFPSFVTANVASNDRDPSGCCSQMGINRSGEAHFIQSANNLNLNVPGGFFVISNGWGYTDLRMWGGDLRIRARDNDPNQADFVLSELGGNDNFSLQAIQLGNVLGQRIFLPSSTFGLIQFQDPLGVNYTQQHGFIAFDITDLLDENGNNLPADASILGIRVYENQDPVPPIGDPYPINQRLDLVLVTADVVQGVPEPATVLLGAVSLVGLVAARRSRHKKF